MVICSGEATSPLLNDKNVQNLGPKKSFRNAIHIVKILCFKVLGERLEMDELNEAYHAKLQENQKMADEKTAKKRKKRQKQKEKLKQKKKNPKQGTILRFTYFSGYLSFL